MFSILIREVKGNQVGLIQYLNPIILVRVVRVIERQVIIQVKYKRLVLYLQRVIQYKYKVYKQLILAKWGGLDRTKGVEILQGFS